jgi:hypothetical protein
LETPNFGDWSKGSHSIEIEQEVYQRDYFDAPGIELAIEKVRDGTDGSVVIKLTADLPLDRKAASLNDDLLFALNLLQENIGLAGVLPRSAASHELLSTINLQWEIFPPGTAEEVATRLSIGPRRLSTGEEEIIKQRVALFSRLAPTQYIRGVGGMSHYIGAMFADDLVVFENIRRGNALYVLYGDWKEVSQRPRSELLRAGDAVFDRFVHT